MSTPVVIGCSSLCPAEGYYAWYWQLEDGQPMAFSQRVAAWGACQIQEANERYFQVVALVPDDCGGLQAALTASNFLGVTDSAEPGFMTQEAEDACKRERERRGLK